MDVEFSTEVVVKNQQLIIQINRLALEQSDTRCIVS